ncbi:hypothetical protein F4821DRAFT_255695 [Hypoxylon rubiginosum]|uniref:Uncharacterized protein n=1 Tax=Hypoxylon rubiginosum TaxID=110542 RepID=A0ACC0DEL4_9PEZI|nr:hypothetical protein F4821DRAFT_255695 [Hypoxylon rubiginosum]
MAGDFEAKEMAPDKTPFHNDSNWTFMYVILGLIPVAFVAVAVYSSCQNTAIKRGNDIEMATPSRRPRFPWKEPIETFQRRQHSNPYEAEAASIPPTPPPKDQEVGGHKGRRNQNIIYGVAISGNGDGDGESSSRKLSQDLENVPF